MGLSIFLAQNFRSQHTRNTGFRKKFRMVPIGWVASVVCFPFLPPTVLVCWMALFFVPPSLLLHCCSHQSISHVICLRRLNRRCLLEDGRIRLLIFRRELVVASFAIVTVVASAASQETTGDKGQQLTLLHS